MRKRTLFLVLAFSLFTFAFLPGQEQVAGSRPGRQTPPAETSSLDRKIDIDFPGGTLPQLLDLIRKTNGMNPNVIVSKEASQVILPPFSLKDVTVYETMAGLKELGLVDQYFLRASRNQNVVTLTAESRTPYGANNMSIKIFDVSDVLAGGSYGIDDIVTTIETAWKIMGGEPTAVLKYHQETNLLVVVGTMVEMNVVENVLRELSKAQSNERQRQAQAAKEAAQKDLGELAAQIQELKDALDAIQADNARLKAQVDELTAGRK